MKKTKIVLDADVIIHFCKAGMLSSLPFIFPAYSYVVLDDVYTEIRGELKVQLDNQIQRLGNIQRVEYSFTGDMRKELALMRSTDGMNLGRGESACMLYCKYNNDVVGSNNLRDIASYCQAHKIAYLTTFDFLYYAIRRGIISIEEAREFVKLVKSSGGKLPDKDIGVYVSDKPM